MKNLKRKLALASIMLCGSAALALGSLNNATVSVSAETLEGFEVKSAALRVPDETYGAGIRFTIGLGNTTLAQGATTGVLLIPSSSLGTDDLTVSLNHDDLRVVENIQWKDFADGTKEAYLHLYDVPSISYTSNISIRAYIDHDANPQTEPVYSNVVSASVADLADWLYHNDDLTAEELTQLQATYLTYKVVYNVDGAITETSGIYNQTLTAIEDPEKVGYTFGGWWNQAGTHQWNVAETKVSSTVTNLYAKWDPATNTAYTVKIFETTDGGATQTEITADVDGFVSSKTGTTGASVDVTTEANGIVSALGEYYSLNAENSILTGTIAADGTTELKIVVDFDEVAASRVGEDKNTLFFFDRELGQQQVVSATGNSYEYTTEKSYDDQVGSLKVTFPGTAAHNTVDLNLGNYVFNNDDYIEFYVYNDTETPTLSLMFGYTNSTQLIQGEWTRVIGSASWLTENQYFRFYGQAAGFGSGTNVEGSVYISKVKVFSNFVDLSAATDAWYIGETAFTGAPTINNNAPATHSQKTLYQTGDAVTMRIWKHGSETSTYAGFEATFKENIDATEEDKYVSFTAKGADPDLFTVVMFDESGKAFTGATLSCVTRAAADGYTTYVFRIAKGKVVSKFRITPLGTTRWNATDNVELIITNCTIGDYSSLRTGEDEDTLFFMDSRLGPALQQIYRKNQTNLYAAEYTTEMAYGNERGSYKSTVSRGQQESYHNMVWSQADKDFLADTDYVVFYLYSTYEKQIFFSFNRMYDTTGYELMPKQWNRIIVSAKVLKTATWTLIDTRRYAIETGVYFDLYMSKFVRYTADEVQKLADKGSEDTWTLGSTTFMGAPTIANGQVGTNYNAGTEHKKAYIVDGELSVTFVRTNDGYINLNLANSIAVEANTDVYITVVMYDYGRLDKLECFINRTYKVAYDSQEDVGGGYAKVTFKCTVSEACVITSVRFDVEDHSDATMATQLRIKDIIITKEEA